MHRHARLFLPSAALILVACGGGGGGSTPLPVTVAPTITTQPASQAVSAGQTATFSVVATGTPAPSYQWKKNDVDVVGATAASYTTPATTAGDHGAQYKVVVTNSGGSVTSSAATLTVSAAPLITTQPASQIAGLGSNITFQVVATGQPAPTFQWKRNGQPIAGATQSAYTLNNVSAGDSGAEFTVIATNAGGSVESQKAVLTLQTAGQGLDLSVADTLDMDLASTSYSNTNRYTATLPVTIARKGTLADPVTLSVSGLPTGLNAAFDTATLATGVNSANLSLSAATSLAVGSYPLNVVARSGAYTTTKTLTLKVSSTAYDFQLYWVTEDGKYLDSMVFIAANAGTKVDKIFAPLSSRKGVSAPAGTKINFTVEGLPTGITATCDPQAEPGYGGGLTLTVGANVAPGSYSFRLKGELNGMVRYLPTALMVGKSAFWTKTIRPVTVSDGQGVTFPIDLGRNDVFFNLDTAIPTFLGTTSLSTEAPAGITATFADTNPTNSATTPLTITAAKGTAPGAYTVKVKATRGTTTDVQDVTVNVTASTAARKASLQNVEWGQSVLLPDLKLVEGKSALMRAHLLADGPGLASGVLTAVLKANGATLNTLTLKGPATVPTSVDNTDLNQSWYALIPANQVVAGMTVDLLLDGNLLTTVTPNVGYGRVIDQVIVPIIHKGAAPVIASDTVLKNTITDMWPAKDVTITRRAPYVTSISIPNLDPSNITPHTGAWSALLAEIGSLRLMDKSGADYYGFLRSGTGSGVVGIHQGGWGAGIGIDNSWGGEATAMGTFQHEVGHGYNLRHSPDGDAGGPTERYPYATVSVGVNGLRLSTGSLFYANKGAKPLKDIMSYTDPQWVSDFTYYRAYGYFEALKGVTPPANVKVARTLAPHTLVSGHVGRDGQVSLNPLQQVMTEPRAVTPGDHTLQLKTSLGDMSLSFRPEQIDDMPRGSKTFFFLVPGHFEVQSATVLHEGDALVQLAPRATLRSRTEALTMARMMGLQTLEEAEGQLKLRWDAATHPMVNVAYQFGDERITLGLNLKGGELTLPLGDLPRGGQFVITYSDGLNPIHRVFNRD